MRVPLVLLIASAPAFAATPKALTTFLDQHCFECHDADVKKGGLDLTALKFDLKDPQLFEKWVKVHDSVADGEMGIDTAYVTINIVPPPDVTLASFPDTICAGETVNFFQTNSGGANYHEWNFGDGAGWQNTGAGNQAHTYTAAGNYTASYAASIQGATAGCADTASVQVVVLPAPTAPFSVDSTAACNSLVVSFTNTSVNAVSQVWDFGDGTTDNSVTPPPHTYNTVATTPLRSPARTPMGAPMP